MAKSEAHKWEFKARCASEVRERIKKLVGGESSGGFVARILRWELGL